MNVDKWTLPSSVFQIKNYFDPLALMDLECIDLVEYDIKKTSLGFQDYYI